MNVSISSKKRSKVWRRFEACLTFRKLLPHRSNRAEAVGPYPRTNGVAMTDLGAMGFNPLRKKRWNGSQTARIGWEGPLNSPPALRDKLQGSHAIKSRFLTPLRFVRNDNRYYYSLRRPKMTLFGKLCRRRWRNYAPIVQKPHHSIRESECD